MKSWGKPLKLINDFYKSLKLINPQKDYRFNKFMVVCDMTRTIEAELFVCNANDGIKAYFPDLKRLYDMKKAILKDFDYSVEINYLIKYGE